LKGCFGLKIIQFKKHLVTYAPDVLPSVPVVKGAKPVFRKIEEFDLERDSWLAERRKTFSQFLAEGQLGFQLVDSLMNECVAYGWVAINGAKPNHLPTIPQGVCWFHYDRVKDDYQGGGYYKYMLFKRLEFLRNNFGDIEVYCDTAINNLPARWAQKKVGFKEVGVYYVISVGSKRIPYCFWQWGKWSKDERHPVL
jgi:RimJ/RimL family protein N-acetyltransferase